MQLQSYPRAGKPEVIPIPCAGNPEAKPVAPEISLEQRTAVVIDHDPETREAITAMLTLAGFDVHPSPTGRQGVELVRSNTPVLVTLSVELPDIDGYEVLRRMREFSHCYVAMVSSLAEETDILTALHSGADDYLTKPFSPSELRARIDAMLRRPRSGEVRAVAQPGKPSSTTPGVASPRLSVNPVRLRPGDLAANRDARTLQVGYR
ncbi:MULTISPECIES: response regulator transcription factor [unclassified Arthrobacter]|uniref:response regulator transcription factor n=1 Tax=unclassified Arthrobacter TaxID=235627 RepID=UPI0014930F31|nr:MULTISPECIES: response regulator transcription factor [unclassified Arthrobacter]MBE0010220.1 DNA-binding response regulator [Arthrobacter sp. AET 35A]NOJ64036.1 response regulator transcription factor [Arthrobacter sp. 147(2020)]